MELRHLRYFLVMAEELHFARAADRLHIEQSPLSRAIKTLEDDLGVALFERTTRSTRITLTGRTLIDQARRILMLVDQMKASAAAAAAGIGGQLRLGLVQTNMESRLPALVALNREEDPEVEILLQEITFSEQVKGLREGLLDVSLSWSVHDLDGIVREKLWDDPMAVVLPAQHWLAAQTTVSLEELATEVVLLARPDQEPGYNTQVMELFTSRGLCPARVLEPLTSLWMMIPLVAARYGVGFIYTHQADSIHRRDIVVRPIAGNAVLTTYLLRAEGEMPPALQRFVDRARRFAGEAIHSSIWQTLTSNPVNV